jgi:SAM-dependent methyltransferase
MRGKYDQVNEFLKAVGETVDRGGGRFTVVDCGCGKAYLTAGLYFYLSQTLGFGDVRIVGVDRRADVVAAARKMAESLDIADRLVFVESDLADVGLEEVAGDGGHVDMVVSLHACDTATDEALAKAVEWKARYIMSAPCCQHELQKTIGSRGSRVGADADFAGLLRQGILRERLCDILTDSFRAQLLRILGYRTQVVEFVSPDATARNVLIKGKYGITPGQHGPIGEYLALRDYWKVTPWLETRLADRLAGFFEK